MGYGECSCRRCPLTLSYKNNTPSWHKDENSSSVKCAWRVRRCLIRSNVLCQGRAARIVSNRPHEKNKLLEENHEPMFRRPFVPAKKYPSNFFALQRLQIKSHREHLVCLCHDSDATRLFYSTKKQDCLCAVGPRRRPSRQDNMSLGLALEKQWLEIKASQSDFSTFCDTKKTSTTFQCEKKKNNAWWGMFLFQTDTPARAAEEHPPTRCCFWFRHLRTRKEK